MSIERVEAVVSRITREEKMLSTRDVEKGSIFLILDDCLSFLVSPYRCYRTKVEMEDVLVFLR